MTRYHTYCVRAQNAQRRTVYTVALQARTYSQARWWGARLLRWHGVPFVRVSLRREPMRLALSSQEVVA